MKLEGAKILITGGSRGIGRATARTLSEAGAAVGITGRDTEQVKRAAEEIGALPIAADVSLPDDVERTFSIYLERFGGLDCLINNAGIGVSRPLVDASLEECEAIWRVNVLGSIMMAREAGRIFMKQKHGHIVNIGSTAALRGYEGGTAYVASKFALRGMSECWRAELRRYNVRVILINPSEVTTAFGSSARMERDEKPNRLRPIEIAHAIRSALEMDDRGFMPELSVFATNPF